MKALGKKLGKNVRLNKLIEKVTNNLTSQKLQNMALRLKKTEAKCIANKQFREEYDFYRQQKKKRC